MSYPCHIKFACTCCIVWGFANPIIAQVILDRMLVCLQPGDVTCQVKVGWEGGRVDESGGKSGQ